MRTGFFQLGWRKRGNRLSDRRHAACMGLIGAMLLFAACAPAPIAVPAPVLPTQPPQIIVETPFVQIVTFPSATPTVTPVPSTTPTLLPQFASVLGNWSIQIDYWIQDNSTIDQIHYSGQGNFAVATSNNSGTDFQAAGAVTWTIIPRAGSCAVTVNNPQITANLHGQIPLKNDPPSVGLNISLASSDEVNNISASCLNVHLNSTINAPSLAVVLDESDQSALNLPLRSGLVYQSVRGLNTLSGGLQRGTLVTQISLSRA